MKVSVTPALFTLLAYSACSPARQAVDLGGEWDVVQIDTLHITPERDVTPFLGFNAANGDTYGFTGCNRLTGRMDKRKWAEGKVDFSQMGSTRMLCHDSAYEQAMLEALQRVSRAAISNDTLRLTDNGGKPAIILKKR